MYGYAMKCPITGFSPTDRQEQCKLLEKVSDHQEKHGTLLKDGFNRQGRVAQALRYGKYEVLSLRITSQWKWNGAWKITADAQKLETLWLYGCRKLCERIWKRWFIRE